MHTNIAAPANHRRKREMDMGIEDSVVEEWLPFDMRSQPAQGLGLDFT